MSRKVTFGPTPDNDVEFPNRTPEPTDCGPSRSDRNRERKRLRFDGPNEKHYSTFGDDPSPCPSATTIDTVASSIGDSENTISMEQSDEEPAKNLTAMFFRTICNCSPGCFLSSSFSILLLSMGAAALAVLKLDRCPAQNLLPIWLAVFGVTSSLAMLLCMRRAVSLWWQYRHLYIFGVLMSAVRECSTCCGANRGATIPQTLVKLLVIVAVCIQAGLMGIGSVLVYGTKISYDITDDGYCDKLLYIFAFILLTFNIAIVAIPVLFACVACMYFCLISCYYVAHGITEMSQFDPEEA